MEISKEPIENIKELSKDKKTELASKIAAKFKQWDDDRASQMETARKIMEEVYLNQPPIKFEEEDLKWKTDVKLNSLYNIKRAKKSMMWAEMWSNPEQMFEVKGTNEATEKQAKIQKASIVDSLNKMKVQKQYDIAADDLFDIGEMIFKTDWEQKIKVVKRQKKDLGFIFMNLFRNSNGAGFLTNENLQEIEIPYYENARVEAISPFMFVFDHSRFKKNDKNVWNSIWKIYKRFDTLENIKNNKIYNITPDMLLELGENKNSSTGDAEQKEYSELKDLDTYGNQYSVLFCHGDFKIDGKFYKNYIAEVLAGKYLIRFEENPLFINPFIYCTLELDPKTKRGISPLKCALSLINEQDRLANTAMDVQKLKANPPSYVNDDMLDAETKKEGKIILFPGKRIKLKDNYSGNMPQDVKVSGEGINDLINFSDQKISDLTSVSNFMYGNVTQTKRTATELNLVDKGASSQTSKELDIINQDLTIPMIENVAELLAIFKDGNEYIYTKDKGENVEYTITNAIRQSQYEYTYEDRNALANRNAKFEQALTLMQGASQNAELFQMFNWKEIYTQAFEMLGFDNPEKFFAENTPSDELNKQLKQLPPELQQEIVPIFTQQLQTMMQNTQQQGQQIL